VRVALAKEADDRYPTAQDFRRALANASSRSFTIDSVDLSNLLHAVMKTAIDEQNQVLPDNVTQIVSISGLSGGAAVNEDLLAGEYTGDGYPGGDDTKEDDPPSDEFEVIRTTFPETQAGLDGPAPAPAVPVASGHFPSAAGGEGASKLPVSVLVILVLAVGLGVPGAFILGKRTRTRPPPSPMAPATPPPDWVVSDGGIHIAPLGNPPTTTPLAVPDAASILDATVAPAGDEFPGQEVERPDDPLEQGVEPPEVVERPPRRPRRPPRPPPPRPPPPRMDDVPF